MEHYQPRETLYLLKSHSLKSKRYAMLSAGSTQLNPGPDDIPGKLLAEGTPWSVEPLTKLFNHSFQTASFPKDWTRSNVAPCSLQGRFQTFSLELSLTSLVVKTNEQLISNRVNAFLTNHKLLCPFLHWFHQCHSCQT